MKDKKFGLIGHPIAHSLSPSLFTAGYNGKYTYELIEGEDFDTSYRNFIENYHGINVTAPFKEKAYAKADLLSQECRLIHATNLLVKTEQGVMAYNSDYTGVRLVLQEMTGQSNDGLKGMKALIVGCGGAGKAAAAACATLGTATILMNRNMEKAAEMAEILSSEGYQAESAPLEDFSRRFMESDIIIYNIPTAIEQLKFMKDSDFGTGKPKYVLEANYRNPSFDEELLQKMTLANPLARHTGGKKWLLYQALTGYEIFTGEKPDLSQMSAIL